MDYKAIAIGGNIVAALVLVFLLRFGLIICQAFPALLFFTFSSPHECMATEKVHLLFLTEVKPHPNRPYPSRIKHDN